MMTSYPAVASRRLHEQVLNALVESIVAEKFASGESLPSEAEMCEVYGVSRSSVREALRVLAEKGLIEVRHGLGTRVNPPEQWDFMDPLVLSTRRKNGAMAPIFDDLHEARKIVECEVAALAAERASNDDTARLARRLEELRESLGDAVAFADAAFAFHRVLFEATRNRVLLRMAAPIREVLAYTIQVASTTPGALETGLLERETIYRAVVAADSTAARNAMSAHLDRLHRTVGASTPIATA
ncbi:MAG TPA: FadR/GntR family transcriptional regulator [Candidatus Baltobacteraceae bacterium]|jgi:DNA-binding FadR family transcriptional regulator